MLDLKHLFVHNRGMKREDIFTKINLVIFLLIAFFSFLAVFFYHKANERNGTLEDVLPAITKFDAMQEAKRELGYTIPKKADIEKQISALDELRDDL